LHGGARGSGAPAGERNGQYRHGERTKTAIAEQRKFSALLKMLRAGSIWKAIRWQADGLGVSATPAGNLTGLFLDLPELGGKQIELLKEAVPGLSHLAVLWDSSIGLVQFRATQAAAHAAEVTLQSLPIRGPEDFKDSFNRAARERVGGMIVLSSPIVLRQRSRIAALAIETHLPTISLFTLLPRSGALMAYGPNLPDMAKRAATYIDRILKGTNIRPENCPSSVRPNSNW